MNTPQEHTDPQIAAHHARRERFGASQGSAEDLEMYEKPTPFAAELGTEFHRLTGSLRDGHKLQTQLVIREGEGNREPYVYESRIIGRDGSTLSYSGHDFAHVLRRLRLAIHAGSI